jgi:hypothetical protein
MRSGGDKLPGLAFEVLFSFLAHPPRPMAALFLCGLPFAVYAHPRIRS